MGQYNWRGLLTEEEDYDDEDYAPYEDEEPSTNRGLSFGDNLLALAWGLGSLLLGVLVIVLLPNPYNVAGPLIFVFAFTGVLPLVIYEIVKKWRRR